MSEHGRGFSSCSCPRCRDARVRRPLTWRQASPADLDWFPQGTDELIVTRMVQKRGVLRWPAIALVNGEGAVLAIVGACPTAELDIELWSEFSPFAAMYGRQIARACVPKMAMLRRVMKGRAIVIWVTHGDQVAARFAAWLGFVPEGDVFTAPVTLQPTRTWRCRD